MPFWKFSILFSWFCHFSLLEISFNLFLSNASSFNAIAKCSSLGAGKYYSHFFTTLFFRFVWVFSGAHTHKIGQLCPLFDIFRRNSLLNFLIGYWFTLFLASFHKFNCIYNKIKRFKILFSFCVLLKSRVRSQSKSIPHTTAAVHSKQM